MPPVIIGWSHLASFTCRGGGGRGRRRGMMIVMMMSDGDEWWWWWVCCWSCMQMYNMENLCQILKFKLHTSLVILPWLANYRSLIMNTLKKNDWSRFYVLWFKLWSDCMWRGPGLYYRWLAGALHQTKQPIIIPLLLVIFMIYALSHRP